MKILSKKSCHRVAGLFNNYYIVIIFFKVSNEQGDIVGMITQV